jgi:cell division septum initiation protein DivIVA
MSSRSTIEKKLTQTVADLHRAREEIRVLDEQIAYFADNADDARLRSMVSETPLAEQEHRQAARTVAALQRDRSVWRERIDKLERLQDSLLDRMQEEIA